MSNIYHIIPSAFKKPPKCVREDCPEKLGSESQSWHSNYGFAGGGLGLYVYCEICEQVIDKILDPDAN